MNELINHFRVNKPAYTANEVEAAKADAWRVFKICSRAELLHVHTNMIRGRIDGKEYLPPEPNGCGCLFGAICEVRNITYLSYRIWKQNTGNEDIYIDDFLTIQMRTTVDSYAPIERFLYMVRPGDTPYNNPYLAQFELWILEYLGELDEATD